MGAVVSDENDVRSQLAGEQQIDGMGDQSPKTEGHAGEGASLTAKRLGIFHATIEWANDNCDSQPPHQRGRFRRDWDRNVDDVSAAYAQELANDAPLRKLRAEVDQKTGRCIRQPARQEAAKSKQRLVECRV